MNNKIIGIVLVVVGAALAIQGFNVYDSAGSQITRAVSGDTPIEAWVGMVGGVIALLIGITKLRQIYAAYWQLQRHLQSHSVNSPH